MPNLAIDPPVSEKQRRAMQAAAHGHSTLGIPKKVGEEFVGHGDDPVIIKAASSTTPSSSVPIRGSEVHPPRPRVHITRSKPEREKPKPVKARMTPTARDRIMSACDRRAARLGQDEDADEHSDDVPDAAGIMFVTPEGKILFTRRSQENYDDYGSWDFPGGHLEKGETSVQGARRETEEETGHAPEGDLRVVDKQAKTNGKGDYVTFVNFCASEFEPDLDDEHDEYEWRTIEDAPQPLNPGVKHTLDHIDDMEEAQDYAHDSALSLALDRDSSRTYDADGYLHVKKTPISKANICPYAGKEIPGYEEMGLDPDHVYQLLRDPEELAKAAPTFHGKPLLDDHEPTSADDHQTKKTVGAVSNPVYEHPYLYADLSVWPGDSIERTESEEQKQLSSGYRYVADMTPGVYAGANYDGIMRSIVGNHVALVREGRAGADVVIGDAALEGVRIMPATAAAKAKPSFSRQADKVVAGLRGYLRDKLATDVSFPHSLFAGVTKKNYTEQLPVIEKSVRKLLKGKLAQDASINDLHELLNGFSSSPEKKGEDDVDPVNSPVPVTEGHMTPVHPDENPMHSLVREHLTGLGKLAPDDIEGLLGRMKEHEAKDAAGFGAGSEKAASTEIPGPDEKDEDEDEGEDEITPATGEFKESDPQFQAADDPPPFEGMPKVGKGPGDRRAHDNKRGPAAMDKKVRKSAMDAAIAQVRKDTRAETIALINGINEAKEKVRPYVGVMAGAFDSAEGVYRQALAMRGVPEADKLHADALLPILTNLSRATERTNLVHTTIAADAKQTDGAISFEQMYGTA
jgi:hypothetical protein